MDYQEVLALYDAIIAKSSKFERLGKTMPYTAANTYMFSLVNKDGQIGIRLPKEMQEEFREKHQDGPYKSYGAVMKDYVLIPASMHKEPELIAAYLDAGFEYVMSLPPQKRKGK